MNKSNSIKALSLGLLLSIAAPAYAASSTANIAPASFSSQMSSATGTALTYGAQAAALGALGYSAYQAVRSLGFAFQAATSCDEDNELAQKRNNSLARALVGLCIAGGAHATTKIQWTGLLFKIDVGALIGGVLNYLAKNK